MNEIISFSKNKNHPKKNILKSKVVDYFKDILNNLLNCKQLNETEKRFEIDKNIKVIEIKENIKKKYDSVCPKILKKLMLLCIDIKDFQNLYENDIALLIESWNLEPEKTTNLNRLIWLCKNLEELQTIFKNTQIKEDLPSLSTKNFENIINFCDCISDLEYLYKNPYISISMKEWNEKAFKKIILLCNTIEEFNNLFNDNKGVYYIMFYCNEKNFLKLFDLYNINSLDKFNKFLKSPKIEHYKKIMRNYSIKEIKELYYLASQKGSIDNIFDEYYMSVWTCRDNEDYNINILKWKSCNYLLVKNWNDILWYIKKDWDYSFLSFENVFDNQWNLLFLKGWIYYLDVENLCYMEKTDDINIKNHKKILRNPMRKIRLKNFDKLVDDFKSNINIKN